MHLVVCMKQILDPEIPPSQFRVDPATNTVVQAASQLVMSTFDECALEVALQCKDQAAESCRVTALTVGDASADEMLRKALALRCDEVVRVEAEPWQYGEARQVAMLMASAIQSFPQASLILCGRQAGDWDSGVIGFRLAEVLGWPVLADVVTLRLGKNTIMATRHTSEGEELWEVTPPAVVTVTNSPHNVLRLPKVRDVLQAARRSISVLRGGLEGEPSEVVKELRTVPLEGNCYFPSSASLAEQVADIVEHLRSVGLT